MFAKAAELLGQHVSHSFFICKSLHSFTRVFILHIYMPRLGYIVLFLNHLTANGSSKQLDHKPHEVNCEAPSGSPLYPSIPVPPASVQGLTRGSHIISCPWMMTRWRFWLLYLVETFFLAQSLSSFPFQASWLHLPLCPHAKPF